MKKFFMFAALASVAFVSCVKNEAPEFAPNLDKDLVFSAPVVGIPTKGAEINGTVFPEDTNFAVFAYYQAGAETYNPNTNPAPELYMNEVKCEHTDAIDDDGEGTGAWRHVTDKYYWPKNGKLTFIAASPAEDDVDAKCAYKIESTANTLTLNYTSPKELADTAKQVDLLYCDWKADCTASTHVSNETYDGVELAFNHALCIVRLNVKAKDAESAAAIKLTGLSINNIYENGEFTSTYGGTPAPAWDFTGCTRTDYTIIALADDAAMEAGATNNSRAITVDGNREASYILLPQAFATGSNITVNYSIKHGEKWLAQTYVYDLNDTSVHLPVGTGAAAITEWLMGKRYTYNITLGVDEIYFAPSVAAWDDVKLEFDNEENQY